MLSVASRRRFLCAFHCIHFCASTLEGVLVNNPLNILFTQRRADNVQSKGYSSKTEMLSFVYDMSCTI
ncbi:hypothetical protein XENTR_v10002661 [Xenopus tropicalis]|nr:hypothetical protein XENTR_v10002661 [Xenopus tropicalis]